MCGHYFEAEGSDAMGDSDPMKKKSRVRQRTISVEREDTGDFSESHAREEVSSRSEEPADSREVKRHHEPPAPRFDETDLWPDEDVEHDKDLEPEFFDEPEAAEEVYAVESAPAMDDESALDLSERPPVLNAQAPVYGGERKAEPFQPEDKWRSAGPAAPAFDEVVPEDEDEEDDYIAEEDDEAVDIADSPGAALAGEIRPPTKKKRRRRRKRRHPGLADASPALSHDERIIEVSPAQEKQPEVFEPKREEYMATHESAVNESAFGRGSDSRAQAGSGSMEEASTSPQEEGILLGWLVNFDQDSRGIAAEIRAGKFFIGRQRLRKSDMVIPDSAISTPHCLVAASRGEGLKVQDLMSEHGTFIKRKGKESFVQVRDAVSVEHGDAIRFGGYEVLVCLVPFSGRR